MNADEHRCFFELLVCEQAEGFAGDSVIRDFRITAVNGNKYNTNFKPVELDGFKKQARLNSYKKLKGGLL